MQGLAGFVCWTGAGNNWGRCEPPDLPPSGTIYARINGGGKATKTVKFTTISAAIVPVSSGSTYNSVYNEFWSTNLQQCKDQCNDLSPWCQSFHFTSVSNKCKLIQDKILITDATTSGGQQVRLFCFFIFFFLILFVCVFLIVGDNDDE